MAELPAIDIGARAVREVRSPPPFEIDVRTLFRLAFGTIGLPIPNAPNVIEQRQFSGRTILQTEENEYELPLEPLIDVRGDRAIVTTDLAGFPGSVKENMGRNDFRVTIRGFAISEDGFPEGELENLIALFKEDTAIEVINEILNESYDIRRLVIKSASFPAVEGLFYAQAFQLECIEDADVELEFLNNQ